MERPNQMSGDDAFGEAEPVPGPGRDQRPERRQDRSRDQDGRQADEAAEEVVLEPLADYPHIENFLTPLYATGGSSNDGKYSNEEFDTKLKDAAKAQGEESYALYQEAEKMLAEDMPSIPMWYYTSTIGWSEKLDNVKISKASGRPDLLNVTVK